MNKKILHSLVFLSFSIVIFSSVVAFAAMKAEQDSAGELAKYDGQVLLRQDQSSKPEKLETPGTALHAGNQLRTGKESKAFIRWVDGSKIVMQEKSQLNINAIDYLNVDDGTVIFDIAKVTRPQPVRVGVKLAILGIRGTQFIVDTHEKGYHVYLREGDITITSQAEDFKIYKKQIQNQLKQFQEQMKREAKQFKSEMESEFKKFKEETLREHAEFVSEFRLIEKAGISIEDGVLTLVAIPSHIEEQFKLLDEF